jgi:hypothetical protein
MNTASSHNVEKMGTFASEAQSQRRGESKLAVIGETFPGKTMNFKSLPQGIAQRQRDAR